MIKTAGESFFSQKFWNLQLKRAIEKSRFAKTKKTRDKWDRIADTFRDREMYLSVGK